MKKRKILVEPSLLSADFGQIASEAKRIEKAGADAIHIDIMDGHFVPNLTLGPRAVASVNRATDLFLDVHLMIYNPFNFVESFVKAGADRITFHIEATEDVEDTIAYIKKCNIEVGLAFCPETSHEMVTPFLDQVDLILLMTVHPGFGGQAFMPEVLEKVRFTRHAAEKRELDLKIQVDGGIDDQTALECVQAGADVLVSGTHLMGAKNLKSEIKKLRELKA